MTDSKEPAFPAMDFNHREDGTGQLELRYNGLTKREYFAAMIMAGFSANPNPGSNQANAEGAVDAADLLITALNKKAE